jgi:Tfp pilus assembly protein PilN
MRAFNLIPADQRSSSGAGAGKSGGSAFVVLGLLGVLAVLALLYGLASRKISSQQAEISTLNARTQTAQAQAAALAPYVSFAAMHEQRVQAVDQLVDSRFDWAHAFHELGRVLPHDAALSSLTGTIGASSGTPASSSSTAKAGAPVASAGASVASATPPGSVPMFTLSGCATSQTEVAQTIDRLRLIDGVSEVTLQSATKSGSSSGAGASSGGGASGSCPSGTSTFAMQITFDPLPSATGTSPSTSASATPASAAGAPTSATARATTAVGGAR